MTAHFSNHRLSEVALHHLLARIATELGRLHQESLRVEDMLGDVLSQSFGTDGPPVHLQGIDHMTQTLDALSQVLGELARGLDPAVVVDPTAAIDKVSLRDLALALSGQMVTERTFTPHHSTTPAGDVDFF